MFGALQIKKKGSDPGKNNNIYRFICHCDTNWIFKDVTPDPKKNNIIYRCKCHCYSVYIGRTFSKVSFKKGSTHNKIFKNWMANGDNKTNKSRSAIEDHLLNNPVCSKHYNDIIRSLF